MNGSGSLPSGIDPASWTQRAAGLERKLRPADEPAGRERVARTRRVDDRLDRHGCKLVPVERGAARAPLEDPGAAADAGRRRSAPRPRWRRRHRVQGSRARAGIASASEIADRTPGREVDADRGHHARARTRWRAGREANRLAQQRVARDVEVAAVLEPRRVDLLGPELDRDAPVGAHRALAGRVDERDDDAVPGRFDWAERVARRGRRGGPPRSPRRRRRRACRRSTSSHRAQRSRPPRWPPGHLAAARCATSRPRRSASGCSRRTITSRTRSPRQKIDTSRILPWIALPLRWRIGASGARRRQARS